MVKGKGKITPNGVVLRGHEYKTVTFLTDQGFDVELIPPSKTQRAKTADIIMNGIEWEMKAPTKIGKHTLDHAMKSGLKQSKNLIFDLRGIRNTGRKAAEKLQKDFFGKKSWKRLIIIAKDPEKLLTFSK